MKTSAYRQTYDIETIRAEALSILRDISAFKNANSRLSPQTLQAATREMKEDLYELLLKIHTTPITLTRRNRGGNRIEMGYFTRVPDPSVRGGKRVYRKTREDLLDFLLDYYGITEEKASPVYTRENPNPLSLAGIYPAWYAHRVKTVRRSTTAKRNRQDWRRYFEGEDIAYIPLTEMTSGQAHDWLEEKAKGLTSRQLRDLRGIWNMIEGYAMVHNLISHSVLAGLPVPTNTKPLPPKLPEALALTPEEANAFRDTCMARYARSRHNLCYYGVAMMPQLGLRAGELSSILEAEIHMDDHYVIVYQQNVEDYTFEGDDLKPHFAGFKILDNLKKERPWRAVPLTPDAEEMIRTVRGIKQELGIESDYLFARKGGEPIRPQCFEDAMGYALNDLGWTDDKKNGVHTLRRTFVTNLIDNGVSVRQTQIWAGHAKPDTTLNQYHMAKGIPDASDGAKIADIYAGRHLGDKK